MAYVRWSAYVRWRMVVYMVRQVYPSRVTDLLTVARVSSERKLQHSLAWAALPRDTTGALSTRSRYWRQSGSGSHFRALTSIYIIITYWNGTPAWNWNYNTKYFNVRYYYNTKTQGDSYQGHFRCPHLGAYSLYCFELHQSNRRAAVWKGF